jgi:hypothetical protein
LAEQWSLLEFTFHSVLGVDLDAVWAVKSWRWFQIRVHGLLTTDTPLSRHFAPEEEPEPPASDELT